MIFDEYEMLREWREETGLDKAKPTKRQIVKHFTEELFEMCGYNKKETDHFVEIFMDTYVIDSKLNDFDMLDAMNDMKIFATNDTEHMGYDAKECIEETVKEVTSRSGEYREDIGKFIKVINGREYTANYLSCKR
jgi:uncharacterized protein YecA (UPF0149 family)